MKEGALTSNRQLVFDLNCLKFAGLFLKNDFSNDHKMIETPGL